MANQFTIIDNLPAPTNPVWYTNYILPASSEYSIYQFFNKKYKQIMKIPKAWLTFPSTSVL